jgi:hypothetical protein
MHIDIYKTDANSYRPNLPSSKRTQNQAFLEHKKNPTDPSPKISFITPQMANSLNQHPITNIIIETVDQNTASFDKNC